MSQKDELEITNEIKVIVLGSVGVGKTSLITRYIKRKFVPNIPSTSGSNFVSIDKIINNKKYILNLWDTAGQEKYNSLTQTFTKNAKIIILIYSITDRKSFQDLDTWLNLVKERNGEEGYSLGIAANKSDLYEESEVDDKEGRKYAEKIKAALKFTSALKDNKEIDELIDELLNNYISNQESNLNDATIKLDNSAFSDKKKVGCCEGKGKKVSKKHKNNNVKNKNYNSDQTVISNSVSMDEKDLSVF